MSNQSPRGPRPSMPAANTGTLSVAVAVVALILGFLILRDVRAGDDGSTTPGGNGSGDTTTTTVAGGGGTTSTVPFNINSFKIQVANSSGVAGSAGDLTVKLQAANYVVQPPLNTPPGTPKRSKTGVFYLTGCEANAQNVAGVLGGNVEVATMPIPVPLETGSLGEACVLVLLGTDLAMKPLQGLVGSGSGAAATTTLPSG